jgi:hypothetical protein
MRWAFLLTKGRDGLKLATWCVIGPPQKASESLPDTPTEVSLHALSVDLANVTVNGGYEYEKSASRTFPPLSGS